METLNIVNETPSVPNAPKRGRPSADASAANKVKTYKAANPTATSVQTAEALGVNIATVRKIFSRYFPARKLKSRKGKQVVKAPTAPTVIPVADFATHPLYPVFVAAINQAMYGKGERHGGAKTPFFDQPWAHYAKLHGRGFLTGQAAKKLEEAASTKTGEAFEQEMLGAMVYIGMAILNHKGVQA